MLMPRFGRQDRWGIVRRGARGVARVLDKIVLGLARVCGIALAICRRQDRGPFAIEVDQLLGNGVAFGRIAVQEVRR